jgi:hypothetical protein
MPTPEEALAEINETISSGAAKVKYADKEVEYRSLNDLKRIQQDLEVATNGKSRRSRSYGVFNKNL